MPVRLSSRSRGTATMYRQLSARRQLDGGEGFVPAAQVRHRRGHLVVAGIGVVAEYAGQRVIGVDGPLANEKRVLREHLVEWREQLLQACLQLLLLLAPLVEAALAKLAFFVPDGHASLDHVWDRRQ